MIVILLGALTDEEQHLINDIFRDTSALLFNVSLSILHSKDDAEDAVSSAYIKIMNHMERINNLPRPQIAPYCVIIVKNTAIDMLRAQKRYAQVEDIEAIEDINTVDTVWKSLDIQELMTSVKRLNDDEQFILNLHYGHQLGYSEIAVLLETNEETAKKRGQRALKKLRILFERGDYHAGRI